MAIQREGDAQIRIYVAEVISQYGDVLLICATYHDVLLSGFVLGLKSRF